MPPLYVVEQQTKIRIRNRRVQVERDGEAGASEVLLSVPLAQVEQVVIFGNVGLTTPAIEALLAQGCEVVFLSARGEFRGRLVGAVTPHVPLRRAQYRLTGDEDFVLRTAQDIVQAKVRHQRVLLQRYAREEGTPVLMAAVARLEEAVSEAGRKTQLQALRGVEGAATAVYFGALRSLLDPGWGFEDRNRRPPQDPVNVLLSLGYTLLARVCEGAVQTVGLDPYVGFLHEVAYNRPALALDLMEEFRPVVDGVVMWACRSGQVTLADFSPGPPERPVVLSDGGLRRFIQAFETRLDQKFTHPLRAQQFPLRQCIIEQARQIAHRITEERPGYTGMGFR